MAHSSRQSRTHEATETPQIPAPVRCVVCAQRCLLCAVVFLPYLGLSAFLNHPLTSFFFSFKQCSLLFLLLPALLLMCT